MLINSEYWLVIKVTDQTGERSSLLFVTAALLAYRIAHTTFAKLATSSCVGVLFPLIFVEMSVTDPSLTSHWPAIDLAGQYVAALYGFLAGQCILHTAWLEIVFKADTFAENQFVMHLFRRCDLSVDEIVQPKAMSLPLAVD